MHKKLESAELRIHKGTSFIGAGVTFLCHDGSGNIFLAKRSQLCRDEQGRWEPGAGGIKLGETIESALVREISEEYCTEIIESKFLGFDEVFRNLDDGTPTHWIQFRFMVQVDPTQVKIGEPDLVDDSGWFTLNNLPSPTHSQMQPFLDKYETKISRILNK